MTAEITDTTDSTAGPTAAAEARQAGLCPSDPDDARSGTVSTRTGGGWGDPALTAAGEVAAAVDAIEAEGRKETTAYGIAGRTGVDSRRAIEDAIGDLVRAGRLLHTEPGHYLILKRFPGYTCPRCRSTATEEYTEPVPYTDDHVDCVRCLDCGHSWGVHFGADQACPGCSGSGIVGGAAGPRGTRPCPCLDDDQDDAGVPDLGEDQEAEVDRFFAELDEPIPYTLEDDPQVAAELKRRIGEAREDTRHADSKANVLLVVLGIAMTGLAQIPTRTGVLVGGGLLAVAAAAVLLVIAPRTRHRVRWDRVGVDRVVVSAWNAGGINDLADELQHVTRIAAVKYTLIRVALVALATAGIAAGLAVLWA